MLRVAFFAVSLYCASSASKLAHFESSVLSYLKSFETSLDEQITSSLTSDFILPPDISSSVYKISHKGRLMTWGLELRVLRALQLNGLVVSFEAVKFVREMSHLPLRFNMKATLLTIPRMQVEFKAKAGLLSGGGLFMLQLEEGLTMDAALDVSVVSFEDGDIALAVDISDLQIHGLKVSVDHFMAHAGTSTDLWKSLNDMGGSLANSIAASLAQSDSILNVAILKTVKSQVRDAFKKVLPAEMLRDIAASTSAAGN